ncbi:MAG: carbamoyltransferase HypF, partial [Crenarchaeota archaeon]|nr:carbamoyltransferase HypF [Thermoproteota archaeon]
DKSNRRFHAQTVADSNCGPSVYLTTRLGEAVESKDPIRLAGKLLSEGKIVAIKGYGGFHIASSTMLEDPLLRLRAVKHRKEKPFAIMAKNLKAAKNLANINPKEQELLTSPMRPIVILSKNKTYSLSSLVAPNLHNIGIMLPYSGLHYLLFDKIADDSFVMTSANAPNQPIVKDNNQALKSLGETVDYFLFYNRKIAHRCDDSVMRVHDTFPVFIRRSRGFAPSPIRLKNKSKSCVLGLGGELNNTSTILFEDKAFISQHIGDIENIETQVFLQQATAHLQTLTNTHAEVIACDLHPKFNTTILAKELASKSSLPLVQVQHHHAHASALLAEHGLDQIVAITCDGYGYGSDGSAWGGEILCCNNSSPNFSRLAHLENQILLGGDLASRYPVRLTVAMLSKAGVDAQDWLLKHSSLLPYGQTEAELILNQLRNTSANRLFTTSCGRVLDAVSVLLGLCSYRSYEGEPAMKLESAALIGKDALHLEPQICDNILHTSCLLEAIYESLGKISVEDLAYSTHVYLAKGLADLAITHARQYGTKNVGLTGGVACNQILTRLIRQSIDAAKLGFFVHESIPAGDGGLSFGQAVVGSLCKF